jgi:ankyrin repeat protein
MPHKGGGGDKTKQFWDGIKTQKQDAIRWCLNYGGISHATRDDDGYTGLHLAAIQNKPRSMETILDHLRRQVLSRGGGDIRGPPGPKKKTCEEIEEKDDENGMTAFMHACAKGSMECVKLLHVGLATLVCASHAPCQPCNTATMPRNVEPAGQPSQTAKARLRWSTPRRTSAMM